jgi:hypothetical protein
VAHRPPKEILADLAKLEGISPSAPELHAYRFAKIGIAENDNMAWSGPYRTEVEPALEICWSVTRT